MKAQLTQKNVVREVNPDWNARRLENKIKFVVRSGEKIQQEGIRMEMRFKAMFDIGEILFEIKVIVYTGRKN